MPIGALRRRVHALAREIAVAHTEPGRVAAAIFVGAIVGCTPFFGLHLLICIAIAFVLGLNQVVVYAAANISIPPMVPFIAFASVQLGERLLHGRWMALRLSELTWRNAPALAGGFFLDWLLGGAIVGAVVGAIGGAIAYGLLHRRRRLRGADPITTLLVEAGRRYAGLHPRYRVYARMKYRMDPCYRAILPLVPPGATLVDLGTGLGMLPLAVVLSGEGRRAHGVEWDAGKLGAGRHAAQGLDGVTLVEGDVREAPIPPADVISLVDMLHYYDAEVQRALLARCKAALKPGGRLLVREGDGARKGGAAWTRVVEATVVKLGWNRGPQVRFRPAAELRADLEALGFTVRVDEVAGKAHPGNVLFVADLSA